MNPPAGRPEPGSAAAGPGEVLDAVLAALGVSAAAGAARLWQYGSDRLRRSAGDRFHLERILGNELFAPLVSPAAVRKGTLERIDDSARCEVTVITPGGEQAGFLVALARARYGERQGAWLVTGIERE